MTSNIRKYGNPINAYCYANGVIKFLSVKRGIPKGAINIITGPGKVVRDAVSAVARLSYDGKTWLVPGVPEAKTSDDAVDALSAWCKWALPHIKEDIKKAEDGTSRMFRR